MVQLICQLITSLSYTTSSTLVVFAINEISSPCFVNGNMGNIFKGEGGQELFAPSIVFSLFSYLLNFSLVLL